MRTLLISCLLKSNEAVWINQKNCIIYMICNPIGALSSLATLADQGL